MLIVPQRRIWTRQPHSPASINRRYGNPDVFLPAAFASNLNRGTGLTTTAYSFTKWFDGLRAFTTTTNDQTPFTIPSASSYSSFLIVLADNPTSYKPLDKGSYRLNAQVGVAPSIYVLENIPATPTPAQLVAKGSAIFCSFQTQKYVVAHKPPNGYVEYATSTYNNGNVTGFSVGNHTTLGVALIVQWRDFAPPEALVRDLLDNPWDIFSEANPLRYFGVGAASGSPYTHSVDTASYAITFSNPTLTTARTLSVDAASYALTFSNPTLTVDRKTDITATSYAITFADPTLEYTPATGSPYTHVVDPISFNISFSNVTLEYTANSVQAGNGYPIFNRNKRKNREYPTVKYIVDKAMRELYEEIIDENSSATDKARNQVSKLVNPYVDRAVATKSIPEQEYINWKLLESDFDRVAKLIEIWNDQIANKNEYEMQMRTDEEILLMLMTN